MLTKIKKNSGLDWGLIKRIYFEDYIWWCYPNIKHNRKFDLIITQLEFKRNNGLPKNILLIIEVVNKLIYFNKAIKHFVYVLTWSHDILKYYDRYYRYLQNEQSFGKKNFLNVTNGHKLHFISYVKHRELTGVRLNKNHMVF